MSMCEKCWEEANRRTMGGYNGDVSNEYHKLLKERKDNPCYLDCIDKDPDHYSYSGCPSCGYRHGTQTGEEE